MKEETVKVKGSAIVELFKKAKKAVDPKSGSLGEIGDYLRSLGYHITYNGFSVCNFRERDLDICYTATCYDGGWEMCKDVNFGKDYRDWTKAEDVDPEREYDVRVMVPLAKRFAAGKIKAKRFLVAEETHRSIRDEQYFDNFDKADAYARKKAQEDIDSCLKDPVWRRYAASQVVDFEQLAAENGELRHYQWYDCDGHTNWVSVGIEEEE